MRIPAELSDQEIERLWELQNQDYIESIFNFRQEHGNVTGLFDWMQHNEEIAT